MKISGQKDYRNLKLFYDLLKADYFEKNLTIATIAIKLVLKDDQKIIINTL